MIVRAAPDVSGRPAGLAIEQAVAALRAGDPALAERTLRARLIEAPSDAAARAKLADLVRDQGRPREAIMLFRSALKIAPDFHSARLALARLHHAQGETHFALEQLQALPKPLRSRFDIAAQEATLLGLLGRHESEIEIYRRLVRERPREPLLWMSLGNALKYAGRAGEAVKALRQSIKVRPSFGEGWWSLANVKTARFDSRDLEAMRKALRGPLAPDDALHFHFALGKALEDRGDYAASFAHYEQGNAIRAAQLTPPQMFTTGVIDQAIATYDAPLYDRLGGRGHPSREPIFVVGLQRSGSTLVEQILASHPMIEGTAELFAFPQLWGELAAEAATAGRTAWEHVKRIEPDRLQAFGAEYLERTRPFRATDRPRFVDKLPANWMNAGFIRLVFPNAAIVDARRHPLACGFSNFKQHYATGVGFAYSQGSIGRFYFDYLRFMEHIDQIQPGAVHHLLNERLIDDPEGETRRLLDYVGVPFDEACLDFHRTRRAVNTPSAEQVRRPINRDGVDYWRHYEPWLGPLKAALGDAIDRWDR